MAGQIFIALTIAALAAVPIAFIIVLVSFLKHLNKQKREKGEIDLVEEVKAFVGPKKEDEKEQK